MKKTALYCSLLLIFLVVSGCAATNKFSVAEYEQTMDAKFPPVALFSKIPDAELKERCETANRESLLRRCNLNSIDYSEVYRELGVSGLFESVHMANDDVPYQLLISSAVYDKTGAAELGQAAIAGATLMLAPLSTSWEIHIDAVLTWHGQLIRQYQYAIPFTESINLFTRPESGRRDKAKAIVSHLIADFQEDDAFSPETLYTTLEASDYGEQLALPEVVGEYLYSPLVLFPHPFHGAQARYEHRQFQFDFVDVFVYPIPSWEWEDGKGTLARESLRIRKEMEYVQKEGQWEDLDLANDAWEYWRRGDDTVPVLALSGAFSTAGEGERYRTYTYLFMQKDKFIKVRASFTGEGRSEKDVEAFARALLAGVGVPDESPFMARVRKNWRDNRSL